MVHLIVSVRRSLKRIDNLLSLSLILIVDWITCTDFPFRSPYSGRRLLSAQLFQSTADFHFFQAESLRKQAQDKIFFDRSNDSR